MVYYDMKYPIKIMAIRRGSKTGELFI